MNSAPIPPYSVSDPFTGPEEEGARTTMARIVGVEVMQAAIRSPTGDLVQVTPGPLEARILRHSRGDIHVSGVYLSSAIRSSGVTPAKHVTLRVSLSGREGGYLNGVTLQPAMALLWGPGTPYEGYTAPGDRWVSVQIPYARVAERVAPSAGAALGRALQYEVPLTAADSSAVSRLLAEMGGRGESRDALTLPPDPVARATELALGIAARVAGHPAPDLRLAPPADPLRLAERHLIAHLAAEVYVGEAARAAGVAERTLQGLFQAQYGVSPLTYLEALRLHAARRILRRAATHPGTTVAAAARSSGHRHLGRFAGRYRAFFGESPRETLARALGLVRA